MQRGIVANDLSMAPSGSAGRPPQHSAPPFQGAPSLCGIRAPASGPAQPSMTPLAAGVGDDYANKVAEVSVLRSRLQQFERDNARLHNELVAANDQKAQNEPSIDRKRQQLSEVEKLQNELQYLKQDLVSSEGERKRLKAEIDASKSRRVHVQVPLVQGNSAGSSMPQQGSTPTLSAGHLGAPSGDPTPSLVPATRSQPIPPSATAHMISASAVTEPTVRDDESQWRREALLRELTHWEAIPSIAVTDFVRENADNSMEAPLSWFSMRQLAGRVSCMNTNVKRESFLGASCSRTGHKTSGDTLEMAVGVTSRIRVAIDRFQWTVVRGGARFVQVWAGLFPSVIPDLAAQHGVARREIGPTVSLFNLLPQALHAVVLNRGQANADTFSSEEVENRQACAMQLIETLTEVAGKLQPTDGLELLLDVLKQPSLCALLGEQPGSNSLHLPCMRLLQALLQSAEIFAFAHQTNCDENALLAVANLLRVPSIGDFTTQGENKEAAAQDSVDRQECRVAALELVCICLATAPTLDAVLQLRGAPTVNGEPVDTVLQRIILLCHHELLCLRMHGTDGGPSRSLALQRCGMRRQRIVHLSLTVLSRFVWKIVPWTDDPKQVSLPSPSLCIEACASLGRMRPLLASIVDMLSQYSQQASLVRGVMLSSASVLRALLAHIDGDVSGTDENGIGAGVEEGATANLVGK